MNEDHKEPQKDAEPDKAERTEQYQEPQKNRGPENTLRDGSLKATIWRQQGEQKDYFTTNFAKTYTDKDGNLRDGHSFGSRDLLGVAELARQAHQRTGELKREEFINSRRQAQHQDQSPKREAQKNLAQTRSQ